MPPAWEGRAPCLVCLGEHPAWCGWGSTPRGDLAYRVTMLGLDLPHLGVAGPHPLWGNQIL